jgi:uncharacterized membrane protein
MHRGYMHGWGWGGSIAAGVIVLGGLATVIIVVLRRRSGNAGTAQRILADRFVRGEIDAQQYQHDRDLIGR